jgi:TolB-like protein/DNA-binding winged helix-turn-helix (wHTH) protein
MNETNPARLTMRFGAYEVEVRASELRKYGIRIKIQDQPFRVLQVLLENHGEVVTREELQRKIWPSDTFVDFDRGLNNAVRRLREVLGDTAETPRYVETFPKHGYRFIAAVTVVNGAEKAPEQIPSMAIPAQHSRASRLVVFVGLAVLLLAVSAVAANLGGIRSRFFNRVETPAIHSLAVLPLQNLSGDPNQEYFADGMTEELITELSRLKNLKVISRTSVMQYKKTDKSLPEVARELNVEAIVEGSVLRSGDRVRITAQLISGRTDANLWAETYDRNLQDTLAVQEAVATAIAGKIKTSMAPEAATQLKLARTVNLKAHEAYLLGLHEQNFANDLSNHENMGRTTEEHHQRAIEYFRQAISEDPNYAPAYLGLGGPGEPDEVEAMARKALELDDTLSEAHLELGAVLLARDLNWQGAEKEFLRAIEVNPSYAPAHQGYAYFLDAVGKLDEGLREYHRAQELDPANDHLGAALYSRRDYDRLIELERRALATNPPGDTDANAIAHKVLMVAYARTGERKESVEELRRAMACMGFHDFAEEIRRGYMTGGYQGALGAYLRGAKRHSDWNFHWVDIFVYAELGDYDQAFTRLARLNTDDPGLWQWVESGEGSGAQVMPTLASLRVEPMWDPLHSDPRFEALARQIGLPAEPASSPKY